MTDYDLIDPGANWCPDCGLPRGVCDCEQHLTNNPNEELGEWDDNYEATPLCWACGERMQWTGDVREIPLDGGFAGVAEELVYACYNPQCIDEDETL